MSNIIEVEDVLSGSSDEDSSSSSDEEVMFVDEESTVQAPPNIAESQSRSKSPVWGQRGATPNSNASIPETESPPQQIDDTTATNSDGFEDEFVSVPPAPAPPASPPPPPMQYDPFAPKSDSPVLVESNVPDAFCDEEAAYDTTTPILLPMNPEADADLLGGALSKQPSKITKDAKMTGITYQDDADKETADLLMQDSTKEEEEDTADKFDDEDGNTGGFFSRLRNKIPTGMSGIHTATAAASDKEPEMQSASMHSLEEGGNSLPHPQTLLEGSDRDSIKEGDDSDSENGLDGNGNSLPHPDEVLRQSKNKGMASVKAGDLDGNGSSLPHPDEILRQSKNKGMASVKAGDLEGNGNSLPHPDEVLRQSKNKGMASIKSGDLDENGNSLPHPEEVRRQSTNKDRADTPENEDIDILGENGNSLPHPETVMRQISNRSDSFDNERLQDALQDARSNSSDSNPNDNEQQLLLAALNASCHDSGSEEDYYDNSSSDDDASSSSACDLDQNGNSLPHPDELLAANKNSGRWNSSFRVGDLRLSFKSTFNAAAAKDESYRESKRESLRNSESFLDEEQQHVLPMDRTESPTDNDDLLFDLNDNGNSLPNPETVFEESRKKKSALASINEGLSRMREKISTSKSKPANTYNHEERDPFTIEVRDDFDDDDDSEVPMSKKEKLQEFLRDHSKRPLSRYIFFAVLLFILILAIAIPVSKRSKNKKIQSPPGTVPPSVETCVDEIILIDESGVELKESSKDDSQNDNIFVNSGNVACYSTEEPIHFRFKRCRPASPLDWVGVYSVGSVFLDRLWKDYVDGVYLCGGQPCPKDDPNNQAGGPARATSMKSPPISTPGEYQFFLVKDSDWPYEYVKHTPSFRVVKNKQFCDVPESEPVVLDSLNATEVSYEMNMDVGTFAPTTALSNTNTGTSTGFYFN